MINEKTFKKLIVAAILLMLVVISLMTIWPIFISILTGLILGYIFYPAYKLVLKVVKEKNISSLVIVLLILFLLFIPLWFLFPVVVKQLVDAYSYSQQVDLSTLVGNLLPSTVSKDSTVMINTFISKTVNSLFAKVSDSLLNIPELLLQAAVILFVFFFAMRDGEKLKEYAKGISPFSHSVEENLSKQFKDITNSVIYGHIIVGVIQGVLTGIGLFIFGVPGALLLTVIAILAAVIPIIGAWLVWIPAAIFLFTIGHTGAGIGLFLYGAILVSWVDNILRPYIVSRRSNVSSAVVLIGMIGGLIVFGVIGLVIGPLVLAYLIVLLDAYKNKKLVEFFSAD